MIVYYEWKHGASLKEFKRTDFWKITMPGPASPAYIEHIWPSIKSVILTVKHTRTHARTYACTHAHRHTHTHMGGTLPWHAHTYLNYCNRHLSHNYQCFSHGLSSPNMSSSDIPIRHGQWRQHLDNTTQRTHLGWRQAWAWEAASSDYLRLRVLKENI